MNRKDGEVLKELTLESRDPFTKGRTYRWFDSWLVRIVKSGGSELETPSNGRWNWNALDALGVYALSVSWTGLKWKHAFTLGKGAKAQSGVYRQSSRIPNSYGRSFKVNKKPAQQAMRSMDVLNAYQLPFAFGKLGDTAKIGANALVVTITDRANKQQSFARAEVNFSRPLAIFPRNDKYLEADNLFNALWQAELTPLSATDIASIGIKEWLDED